MARTGPGYRPSEALGATGQCRRQTVATGQEEGILDHGLIYSLPILLYQSLSKRPASVLLKSIIFMNTCFCPLRLVTFIYLEHTAHVLLKHKFQSLAHSSPPCDLASADTGYLENGNITWIMTELSAHPICS